MSDVAFQIWDKNGKEMVNMRMNTMRLVDRIAIGNMTTDTKTVYHPACVAGKTKIFLMPSAGSFANSLKDFWSGALTYNMRPRLAIYNGYFQLYVKPGTMSWLRNNAGESQIARDMDALLFTTE